MATRTVEQSRELDVNWCNREGLLEPGARGTLSWTRDRDGEEMASIGYRYSSTETAGDAEGLTLLYTISSNLSFHEDRDVSYTVRIERTECNFGGTRPWFRCPACDDRVAKIYSVPRRDKYVCRDCGGLLYDSQTHKSAMIESFERLDEAKEQAQEWPSRENLREFYEAQYGTFEAHENFLETLDNKYGPYTGGGRADSFQPPDPPPFEMWLSRFFSNAHGYGYYGQCQATAKTTGERCEQSALGEHGKCWYHGGAPGSGIGEGQTDHAAERFEQLMAEVEEQRERDRQQTRELFDELDAERDGIDAD